jgi:nucleotide-binding universal stress UspA family protein
LTLNSGTHRIVVGYDGSQSARAALTYAVSKVGDGKVIVVHVYGPSIAIRDGQRVFGEQRIYRQALLAELAEANGSKLDGIDYEIEPVRGSPAAALADVARSCNADEIVVGSPRLRNASALDSVSYQLLEIADRPVVVVPGNRKDVRVLERVE